MKRVLLVIDTSRASGRKFLAGIEQYISIREDWEGCLLPPRYLSGSTTELDAWLRKNEFDGMIGRDSPRAGRVMKMTIPKVVNDTVREKIPGVSTVYTDSDAIGELAARYFADRGFSRFAFCGFPKMTWSAKRLAAYARTLRSGNFGEVHDYDEWAGGRRAPGRRTSCLSDWISALPKPIGVFSCNDDRGSEVIQACKACGAKVPEEVAVLGVDNDELMCDLSFPSLSSIELDFYQAGFEAATLLDRLMKRNSPAELISVKPISVYTRRSTDIIAVDDKHVVKALVFIRDHFREKIQVQDIVHATGLSRRMLELRFREVLRKSIMDEVWRLRLDYAKKLLANTDYSMYRIADELEYTDPEHFSRFFKMMTDTTPSDYRKNCLRRPNGRELFS